MVRGCHQLSIHKKKRAVYVVNFTNRNVELCIQHGCFGYETYIFKNGVTTMCIDHDDFDKNIVSLMGPHRIPMRASFTIFKNWSESNIGLVRIGPKQGNIFAVYVTKGEEPQTLQQLAATSAMSKAEVRSKIRKIAPKLREMFEPNILALGFNVHVGHTPPQPLPFILRGWGFTCSCYNSQFPNLPESFQETSRRT